MSTYLWKSLFVLVLLAAPSLAHADAPGKRHPLAPSLPLLSDEQYQKIEKVVDQFIDYDSGKLPGADGKRILADFDALGPEAIPPLIEGLNRAGNLQASCPAVVIARKLKKLVMGSRDGQLCDYVRESVGLGVTIPRHMNAIRDIKIVCMSRKAYLQQAGLLPPAGKKAACAMTTDELAFAVQKEKGAYVKQVLAELEERSDEKVAGALGVAMTRPEADIKAQAQKSLLKFLGRQKSVDLKKLLKAHQEEVRLCVLYTGATRKPAWGDEFIDALDDASPKVRQFAHQILIHLNGGKDFGPAPNASANDHAQAIAEWRSWWESKGKQIGKGKQP